MIVLQMTKSNIIKNSQIFSVEYVWTLATSSTQGLLSWLEVLAARAQEVTLVRRLGQSGCLVDREKSRATDNRIAKPLG